MDINRILRETFVVEAERHAELGSTNDRAIERAKLGARKLPLLVLADRQTAGRGRDGNHWWTGQDCMAFSLLLESATAENPNSAAPLISLAAGLAVVDAIKPLLEKQEIGIHWPNDVIAAGGKVAGILVEVLPKGHIVIGIGINTNNSLADAPAELLPIATTLLDLTGVRHDHTDILIAIINRFEKHIVMLKQAPDKLTARADAICLQHDKPLIVQCGRQTITGLCRGIASDGALLLETTDGLRSIYSGRIVKR